MNTSPLFPEQASTIAAQVDNLYFFLLAVSLFFTVFIFFLVFYFAIKFRRRSRSERPRPIVGSLQLEILWTVIPTIIAMVMFVWGAHTYFRMYRQPEGGLPIYVVAKQWMWKFQHPEGRREINELHVPVGTTIKLIMISEDVIHSLFFPAFRTKMDVLPGRYTTNWFEATKPGRYHLFCTEYCGTKHSEMGGWVYVMEPVEYETWLSQDITPRGDQPMVSTGGELFQQLGCLTCHSENSGSRGPDLAGLFGRSVALNDGRTLIADESYIRESIVKPAAKVVQGYEPLMPTYEGQLEEEEFLELIAYVKSLPPSIRQSVSSSD